MKRMSGTVRRVASTVLPTKWGAFQLIGFERPPETAIALILDDPTHRGNPTRGAPLLRIHSQCFTGDVLRSLRCDCGDQLELAMRTIAGEGCGVLIYEHQEGRGIGLMAKLQAYALQDAGLDTRESCTRFQDRLP
jgi:GTP cyclohydrolase II